MAVQQKRYGRSNMPGLAGVDLLARRTTIAHFPLPTFHFPLSPYSGLLLALSLLSLAWLVSGCARGPIMSPEAAQAEATYVAWTAQVNDFETWRLAGQLTLELPEERWTGQLSWRSIAQRQVVDWSGPMGRGGGRLFLQPEGVRLVTREGEEYQANTPDELMVHLTGQAIPIAGLQYWIRGLVQPDIPHQLRLDAYGQPMRLLQDGWEIRFGSFALQAIEGTAQQLTMPMGLELQRGEIVLRLTTQRWQITGPVYVQR